MGHPQNDDQPVQGIEGANPESSVVRHRQFSAERIKYFRFTGRIEKTVRQMIILWPKIEQKISSAKQNF